jgi:NAD/NADP transhydrogenase alpha subunit
VGRLTKAGTEVVVESGAGTSATRRSPGTVSRGTPTFI